MPPILKSILPPFFLHVLSKTLGKGVQWYGNYKDWRSAVNQCKGYDDIDIFKRVSTAALKVKAGQALYERDAVLFHTPNYSWELIANLLKISAKNEGSLCVLDFGGSLGSSYFQNKKYFSAIKNLTWCVVEQKHFVDFGKVNFADETLKFYHSIEEVLAIHQPNVLLLLSVIQYLEKPKEWITIFKKAGIPNILIDRTAFIEGDSDRICVQKIPKNIYKASYPAWFFNEDQFIKEFQPHYKLLSQSSSNVTKPTFIGLKKGYWKNFVFKNTHE